MRDMGLVAICPGPNLSKRNQQHHVYPYLLRNVTPSRPNQVWGIDITYIRMNGNWMYLVAVTDWYSRYIVSWELSQTLAHDFVLNTVRKAFEHAVPEILNSDQGGHFTSPAYIGLLKEKGVKISMDGKGRASFCRAFGAIYMQTDTPATTEYQTLPLLVAGLTRDARLMRP